MDTGAITEGSAGDLPELSTACFNLGSGMSLRPFALGDEQILYEAVIRNADHLTEFMQWMTPDYSLKMAGEFIERTVAGAAEKTGLNFGFFEDDKCFGSIGFVHFHMAARRTEIGYWIDKTREGKGIVSEACETLFEFAFDALRMNRIEIRCSTQNRRSAAIPRRFGFKEEGRLRDQEIRNGTHHDYFVFGLLRSEWNGKLDQ